MLNNNFNIHSLPFLITSLVFLSIPSYIFIKNKKNLIVRKFFILGLAAFVWYFPYFIIYNLSSKHSNLIISFFKIAYIGLVFIPASLYSFIVSFLFLKRRFFIRFFYIISFILVFFVIFTDYIVGGFREFKWGYCTKAGQFYDIFLLIWGLPLILSFKELLSEYKKTSSDYKRRRIRYLLIILSIAYLSTVDTLVIYGINIYPIGFMPLILFAVLLGYAIFKYRLFNINIIVKKISLIVAAFILAVSLIYLLSLSFQSYIVNLFGNIGWIFFSTVISFLVSFSLFYFIRFIIHLEEEEFFKKFLHKPILKKEAERVSTAEDIYELLTYVIRDLSTFAHLDYVAAFIEDEQNKKFKLIRSINRRKNENFKETYLDYSQPLLQLLTYLKKPLVYYDLKKNPKIKKILEPKKDLVFKAIKKMEEIDIEAVIPGFCEGRLLLLLYIGKRMDDNGFLSSHEIDIFFSIANNIARAIYSFLLKQEKIKLIVASQKTIISAIEAKDSYTRGHTDRVASYTLLIGERIKELTGSFFDVNSLFWSAQLHDVGKIAIPDTILLKPTSLTKEEWEKIKMHPVVGLKIIEPVKEWLGEDICLGIGEHHENFDGSGYPFSKKGNDIHIFARIIRVADAFDAMTSNRPYRAALSRKVAIDELNKYKEIQFDPSIVKIMEDLYFEGKI